MTGAPRLLWLLTPLLPPSPADAPFLLPPKKPSLPPPSPIVSARGWLGESSQNLPQNPGMGGGSEFHTQLAFQLSRSVEVEAGGGGGALSPAPPPRRGHSSLSPTPMLTSGGRVPSMQAREQQEEESCRGDRCERWGAGPEEGLGGGLYLSR